MLPSNNDKHTPIGEIKERPNDLSPVSPLFQSRRFSSKGFAAIANLEVNREQHRSFYGPPMRWSRDSERFERDSRRCFKFEFQNLHLQKSETRGSNPFVLLTQRITLP